MGHIDVIATAIIKVMEEDPTKILDCQQGWESMKAQGATFDNTREDIMGEEALFNFKTANPTMPEVIALTPEDEEEVEDRIIEAIRERSW